MPSSLTGMVDRRDIGSWLQGPGSLDPNAQPPGVRLGLPADGPGSVARFGRRVAAIMVDYALCGLISTLFGYHFAGHNTGARPFIPLVVFFVENVVLVGTAGFTIGHRLFGMQVRRLSGDLPGPLLGFVRSLLLCLAVPALIWDRDQRGVHDRVPGTVLVRI
jgi:uncharacterized RDD family membrane protein YckC